MKQRMAELASRRLVLLAEIESQRIEVAEIAEQWRAPLLLLDSGLSAVRFVRNHPGWLAGSALALLIWRRHGLVGLVHEGWRSLSRHPAGLSLGLKYLSWVMRFRGEARETLNR